MILTGHKIKEEVTAGRIVIEPFNDEYIEPNSYRFHLNDTILVYKEGVVDAYDEKHIETFKIPPEGMVLYPKKFYLGCTLERMGSFNHASELYARLSTSLAGIFIQTSAPLGHTGAIIPWTLEILVAQPVRVYAGMPIGKICFWENCGEPTTYSGRYKNSNTVLHSKLTELNR
ncbi:deoxycytidine triphosphate deaminase [Pseudomonas protegens]|uniref:Deoxycytidine triphosphate deaminase n=1 Tax=Pseudomonas protegens TaxID=380021 RepID=A0A2T6GAZ1_9PSED|nr:deoxycytidine triphosphate deaminase [Pseudomonas protegens]PUA41319.1 deoxycytidine triphosphate deaminase [Pseudomonas protegens]